MFRALKLCGMTAIALAAPTAAFAATNLVVNGSFEANVLGSGNYRDYFVGTPPNPNGIAGWTIVGVQNTRISLVDKDYAGNANDGYFFPAQDGIQFADLAGYSDNAQDGLSQTVATTIGSTYDFSFWLGNVTGGGFFGVDSKVDVAFSSGATNFSCVNSVDTKITVWQKCSATVNATSSATTFTITNRDPQSDYSSLIDNVVFSLADTQPTPPSAVPEPTTWMLQILGFGLAGTTLRRRKTAKKASALA